MFKRRTIFSKLFLSYLFIIIISLLLFIGIFFYLFHIQMYKDYEKTFEYEFEKIEFLIQEASYLEMENSFRYTFDHADYQMYMIDKNGKLLYGPTSFENSLLVDIDPDIMNAITKGEHVSNGGFMNGELLYVVAAPFTSQMLDGESTFLVMVFHEITHEYKQVILMIVFTFIIAMLFTAIILWFISKKITKPLREMNETAILYAKGDFSKSVKYETNDEIGQLAKSFAYMANELNQLENRRKTFVSNVSHDLRSPLTSMKGFLIALIDGTIPDDRRHHYYGLMKDETERMIKLVNDTLEITRLEEGQYQLSCSQYDITAQIKRIIHKFEPQIDKKKLEVRFKTIEPSLFVYADEERIEQVIINLLQNAIQFSHVQSPIDILLQRIGKKVQLSIQDYGEGMTEDQLHAIWKRFYKADEARTNKSGFGLGLAIVKSILDLHDAEINVKSKLGEGTTFSFTLPMKNKM